MIPIGKAVRADDDGWVDDYGLGVSIGTVSTLGGDKPLPKGWAPPVREFPIGFHVAAPGPSHDEVLPEPPRKPPVRRRRAAKKA